MGSERVVRGPWAAAKPVDRAHLAATLGASTAQPDQQRVAVRRTSAPTLRDQNEVVREMDSRENWILSAGTKRYRFTVCLSRRYAGTPVHPEGA